MIATLDSVTLFGSLAAPVVSLILTVMLLFLCLGKKKNQDSENGIIATSGSYSKGNHAEKGNQNQVYAEPDVVLRHKENEVTTSPQSVVVDISVTTEKSSSLPRSGPRASLTEGKLWGTDGSPSSSGTPPRPREPTPNLSEARKSIQAADVDQPYATSRQFVLETSGSGETSGNGLYARVKQVERIQDEIAYSVVNLEKKEEDYEFVGNQVRRKSSQDLDKEDFPAPFSGHASPLPHVGDNTKKGGGEVDLIAGNIEVNALYSQVEETVPAANKRSYHEEEVAGSDLYATVSEVPKHNSLPNNAKGGRWKPFKQSKRRSRTVEESHTAPAEESLKGGDKKGSKKKLARLKSDPDDPKNVSPITPPLPPLENLKTKAKENNWRRSGSEDPAVRPSEVTPASSPRLGALPSIPVYRFDFQRPPAPQEEYDEDDTYEKLGSGGVHAKASSLPKYYDAEKSSNAANASSASGRPQSSIIEKRPHTSVTTEGGKYELVVSPSPRGSLSHVPPPQFDLPDGVADMYAQVDKTKGAACKARNNNVIELPPPQTGAVSEMYATVNKERSNDHKEQVAIRTDKGGVQTHALDTATSNLYATVDIPIRGDQQNFDSLGVRDTRTQSESIKKRHLIHGDPGMPANSSNNSDLLKPRANTEPLLDPKAMYAQVDLEKKRMDREIRDTYSLVNKVRTGRKTLHHAEPEVKSNTDTLYEGTYSIIPVNHYTDNTQDEINDQGQVSSKNVVVKVDESYAEVAVGGRGSKDMETVSATYSNDGEAYARVDEL